MSSADAEAMLKKIRKMEANRICPNCGTSSPTGLGFGNICIKFKTFVCDSCKTSHAAISHRCKSVAMSSWTVEEVKSLTSEYNGGNLAAAHNWLYSAPPFGGRYNGGVRPKQGDRIDVFKQFVIDCYEKGMFKASMPFEPPVGGAGNKSVTAPVRSQPAPTAASANFFDDDFGQSTPSPLSAPSTAGVDSFFSSGGDAFSTPAAPVDSGFDFFTSSQPSTGSGTSSGGFAPPPVPSSDDFFSGMQQQPAPTDMFGGMKKQEQQFDDFFDRPAVPAPISIPATAPAHDPFGTDFLTPTSAPAMSQYNSPMSTSSVHSAPASTSSSFSFMNTNSQLPTSSRGSGGMAISSMMDPNAHMGASYNSRGGGGMNTGMARRGPTDNFDFVRDSLGQSRGGSSGGQPMGSMNSMQGSRPMGGMTGGSQYMSRGMMAQPATNQGVSYPLNPPAGGMGWGAPPQQQQQRNQGGW